MKKDNQTKGVKIMNQANTYYGITQSHCGHEYRWIFTKEKVMLQLGEEFFQELIEDYGPIGGDIRNTWDIDVEFPIGGSNSSATYFQLLNNDEEAKYFLCKPALGPDVEDPTLVDIAEYLLTVDTNYDSCTQEFIDKFGLNLSDLEQYDDEDHHREKAEQMIATLLSTDQFDDIIDRENPFYGFSSDLRFSTLCDMYEVYTKEQNNVEQDR